ncbi:DUF6083 domain-containing protein [Kitasatospora sp. NPDC051853]|uniref:DUF6083 domain-containing protein n=1 Tax=Kitasatospora sp. NPDC051853 TaxID=3364058 RepID=UPI0037A7BA0A
MTSCMPGYNWDGSRKGPKTTRALRIDPQSPSRLIRSARTGTCAYCGNTVEWCQRDDQRPLPLHPTELDARIVPPHQRWHLHSGIAQPTTGGSPWCHIAHPALCPATGTPAEDDHEDLTRLRRALAVRSRRLIDLGFIPRPLPTDTAPPPPDPPTTPPRHRPVVHMLHTHYLAPGPLPTIRCVSMTVRLQRCSNRVADGTEGQWVHLPVDFNAAAPTPHLAAHLAPTEMTVYQLSHLPLPTQLRWRGQRCEAHSTGSAAEIALPQWEPFDPFIHREHIRTDLPAAAQSAGRPRPYVPWERQPPRPPFRSDF